MKTLVTGGNGFIGSNFIRLLDKKGNYIINVDSESYAGKGKNIKHAGLSNNSNYRYYKADIRDSNRIMQIFEEEKPDVVVNFAAESHVDRSIQNPGIFIETNVYGTFNLLEASKKNDIRKFVQISTDEVYGSLDFDSSPSIEDDLLKPRSPYSATKASAEAVALSYFHTFGLPVVITRSSNNYGSYQFPEKLISLFVTNLIDGKKVPLMYSEDNPGLNVRDWLYVEDNCKAILGVIEKGVCGEIYNIAGGNEKTNMEIADAILCEFGVGREMIDYVSHRRGHDFRYSVDSSKLEKLGIGFEKKNFEEGLRETIRWYKENQNWWRPLKEC